MYITRISRVAHNSKQVISNNEETPVTSLFRGSSEEFSYENVNLKSLKNSYFPYIFVYHMYTIYQVITYDNSFLLNLHIILFSYKNNTYYQKQHGFYG